MTDPTAALEEALRLQHEAFLAEPESFDSRTAIATFLLTALPPDALCTHAELSEYRANMQRRELFIVDLEAVLARLRPIEEAARALLATGGLDTFTDEADAALTALRAALEK